MRYRFAVARLLLLAVCLTLVLQSTAAAREETIPLRVGDWWVTRDRSAIHPLERVIARRRGLGLPVAMYWQPFVDQHHEVITVNTQVRPPSASDDVSTLVVKVVRFRVVGIDGSIIIEWDRTSIPSDFDDTPPKYLLAQNRLVGPQYTHYSYLRMEDGKLIGTATAPDNERSYGYVPNGLSVPEWANMNPTGLQRYLRLYPPIYSIDCNATNLPDETPFLIEPDRLEDREDDVPWSVAFDGKMHSSYRVIRRTPDGKRIFATRTWKTVKQGGPHSMPIGTHDFLLEEEWSPATIHRVSRRWFKDGDGVSESYLLDWSGRPPDFNTWPPQGGLLPTPSPWPPPVKPLTPDEQRIYERMDSLHTLAGTLQKEKDDAEEIYREAKKEEEIQFGRDPKSDLYRDTKRYLESATDELRRKEDALGIVRRKIDDELSALGVTREPKGRLNAGKPPAEAPGTVAQPTTDPPASASKNELPASDARPGSVSSTKAGGSEAPSASASGGAAIPAPVEAAGGGADRVSQPQGGARRAPSPFAAIGWLEILIAAGVLAAGAAATATAFVLLRRRW